MLYFTYLAKRSSSQSPEHLMGTVDWKPYRPCHLHRVTSGDLRKHLAGDVPMEASERGTGRRG